MILTVLGWGWKGWVGSLPYVLGMRGTHCQPVSEPTPGLCSFVYYSVTSITLMAWEKMGSEAMEPNVTQLVYELSSTVTN